MLSLAGPEPRGTRDRHGWGTGPLPALCPRALASSPPAWRVRGRAGARIRPSAQWPSLVRLCWLCVPARPLSAAGWSRCRCGNAPRRPLLGPWSAAGCASGARGERRRCSRSRRPLRAAAGAFPVCAPDDARGSRAVTGTPLPGRVPVCVPGAAPGQLLANSRAVLFCPSCPEGPCRGAPTDLVFAGALELGLP